MTLEELSDKLYESKVLHDYKDGKIDYRKVHEFIVGLNEALTIPVVSITEGKLCEICEENEAKVITEHCHSCDQYIINGERN